MAYSAQPRNKDHWSMRLHVKRPGGVRPLALVVAAIQTLLLALTASSMATGGGLYGCTSACGTAAQPVTPALAVFLGIVMLVLPLVIGALCAEWQSAVALSVIPVIPALLIASNTLLTPTNTIVPPTPARGTQPAVPYPTSHFGPPFWLDPAHLPTLLFAFVLFALLGWLGWVIGSAFRTA
ncbi:MAG TPA: hypothetical protein VFW17_00765 [Ktedonobacterales bacterium]|jgi:hypothetical protein|nr:hypothetical protein [Ktedonobacterales bacterium]